MSRESRVGYEFTDYTKSQVRKEQKQRCAVTGERGMTEVHHMLPVCLAHGFFPTVNKAIFTQKENAIALSPEIHVQVHEEISAWPPEFVKVFTIGMYKYLKETYNANQEKIEHDKALLGSGGSRRIG